jgi:hypothetical protein
METVPIAVPFLTCYTEIVPIAVPFLTCYTEIVSIEVPFLTIVFCPTRYFTRQGLILSTVHILYTELCLTLSVY